MVRTDLEKTGFTLQVLRPKSDLLPTSDFSLRPFAYKATSVCCVHLNQLKLCSQLKKKPRCIDAEKEISGRQTCKVNNNFAVDVSSI